MNKKNLIIILLLFLFISGCQYFGRKTTAEDIYTRYHRGHQGLELKFVPTAPPPVVYDQPRSFLGDRDEITVLVEIRNKGAFDIGTTIAGRYYGKGYLLLHGYDETIIRNLKPNEPLTRQDPRLGIIHLNELDIYGEGIEGKSKYNAEGGYAVIEFPPKASLLKKRPAAGERSTVENILEVLQLSDIVIPEGSDYYRPTFVATACYEYMTEASPQVCIDPDPYSERTDKACRVGGISRAIGQGAKAYVGTIEGIAGGQGAPVAVTNIEETAMPGRADFKIYIQNMGGGDVLHLDTIDEERCGFPSLLTYRDFDYIHYIVTMNDPNMPSLVVPWFDVITVPGKQLKCEPKSPVRLDATGRAIIHCTTADFDFFGKSAYKTPLNIRLLYGYSNSAMKTVEIRSST